MRCHFLLAGLLSLNACALVSHPRPAAPGTLELEVGAGGPLVNRNGTVFPLPAVSAGARYGVGERFDLHGHVHLGTLIQGSVGADFGSTVLLLPQEGLRPALTATGRAFAFTDFRRSFRPFGEVAAHASWKHSTRFLGYVSGSALVDLSGRNDGIWSLGAGEAVTLGSWTVNLELRAYSSSFVNELRTLQFPLLLDAVPVGVLLGVGYRFGEEKQ